MVNPWPGKKVKLVAEGAVRETLDGERFTVETKEGQTVELSVE